MPNKKQSIKEHRDALILEARAGLIPESDWIVKEVRIRIDRTARINRVVKSHAKRLADGSDRVAISEILADLRHYCDAKELAFDELDAAACEKYMDEASQSSIVSAL